MDAAGLGVVVAVDVVGGGVGPQHGYHEVGPGKRDPRLHAHPSPGLQ